MKKFILLTMLTFIAAFISQAQDYEINGNVITMEEVVTFSGDMNSVRNSVHRYLTSELLKDSNTTLKANEPEYLIAKVITPRTYYSLGAWYTYADITIEVRFKEGRSKILITCDGKVTNASANGGNTLYYYITEAAPFAEKHNIWKINVTKQAAEDTFKTIINTMKVVFFGIRSTIISGSEEEDW